VGCNASQMHANDFSNKCDFNVFTVMREEWAHHSISSRDKLVLNFFPTEFQTSPIRGAASARTVHTCKGTYVKKKHAHSDVSCEMPAEKQARIEKKAKLQAY